MDTVTRHTPKHTPKKPSQAWAAQRLGVTREHLNRVLKGRRTSRRLVQRYEALMGKVAA